MLLPASLVLLISTVLAQRTQLALNQLTTQQFNASNPSLSQFTIPKSSASVALSIAICTNQSPLPRFFFSNDSDTNVPSPNDTGQNVHELQFDGGLAVYSGVFANGGVLAAYPGDVQDGQAYPLWTYQVGLSDGDALNSPLTDLALLGDTTSSQALMLSPAYAPYAPPSSSYPNYTLPAINASYPPSPSSVPNFTMVMFPSSTNDLPLLQRSACGIQDWFANTPIATGQGNITTSIVSRGNEGFRTQWIIEGLQSATNFTAYLIQDNTRMSVPVFFSTKSSSFACSLLHSLPFCPKIAYSVPLNTPTLPATTYSASNLDPSISSALLSSLSNFSSVLSVFPCGRDMYSPIRTCAHCLEAYRTWLCSVSFPQCAESPSSGAVVSPSPPREPPTPALLTQTSSQNRSPILPALNDDHAVVLPCIETCQEVDRACPPLMQWKCPLAQINANWTYGLGFIDGVDGVEKAGRVGGLVSGGTDQWGNIWCSG